MQCDCRSNLRSMAALGCPCSRQSGGGGGLIEKDSSVCGVLRAFALTCCVGDDFLLLVFVRLFRGQRELIL